MAVTGIPGCLLTTNVWDDAAAEIKREAAQVADYLGRVGVLDGLHRLEWLAKGAYLCGRIVEELHECL